MWLKMIQYTLVLWLTQNLPLPACSTEENTLIEQNVSVSWFFLSLLSPFGWIIVSLLSASPQAV